MSDKLKRFLGSLLIIAVIIFAVVANMTTGASQECALTPSKPQGIESKSAEVKQPEIVIAGLRRDEADAIYAALASREVAGAIEAGSSPCYAPRMIEHLAAHKADNGLYRYRTDTSGRTQYPDDPDWRTWPTEEAQERGYADYSEDKAKDFYNIPAVFLPSAPAHPTSGAMTPAQRAILQRVLEREKQRALFRDLNGISLR